MSRSRLVCGVVVVLGVSTLGGLAPPPASAAPAAAARDVVFSPTLTQFGHVGWHGTVDQPVSVYNHGTSPIRIGGPASSDPRFTFGRECAGVVLAAGDRCTTLVTFTDDGTAPFYVGQVLAAGGAQAELHANVDDAVTVTSSPVFPTTPDGTTTPQKTVALINSSATVVEFGPTADAEPSAMQFTATACLGRRLQPGGSCTVRVAYRPGDGAADTGRLSLPIVGGRPVVVTASGTSLPRSAPDTDLLDFGVVPRGSTGTRSVTYRNTSTGPSVFGSATVTGGAPYRILTDGCSGATVAAGGTCAVAVRVRSSAATENLHGNLLVPVDGRTNSVQLSAVSLSPLLFPIRALDFGAVTVGQVSPAQDAAVTNVSGSAVTLHTSLPHDSPWRYDDDCDGVVLAPGAGCRIGVAFAPTRAGNVVTQPFASVNGQGLGLRLTGRAVTGAPTEPLLVTPRGFFLGAVEVGAEPPSRPVTITNTGAAPVTLSSGRAPGPEVRRVDDACTGTTLAPGGSCVVRYTRVPRSAPTTSSGYFVENWNGVRYEMTDGVFALDRLRILQGRPQFGAVELGQPARTSVDVRNVGSRSVPLTDPFPFDATAQHRVVRDGCIGQVLAPGATCSVTLEITPRSLDDRGARISGQWNRQDLDVDLGVSPLPWLAVDTSRIEFPPAVAGQPAAARAITLTNVGDVTRALNGHCVAPRYFDGDDCRDVTLAPGQSVQLSYRPSPFLTLDLTDTLDVVSPPTAVRIPVSLVATVVLPLLVSSQGVVLGPEPVGAVLEDDLWLVNSTASAVTAEVAVGGAAKVPDLAIRDDCTGVAVAPGGRCALHLTFRPTQPQHRFVYLHFAVNGVRQNFYLTLWSP